LKKKIIFVAFTPYSTNFVTHHGKAESEVFSR
jgi:hypothetical protein